MNCTVETGSTISKLFARENYLRDLESDVVGVYFKEDPSGDKVKVIGQITCPGCMQWYPFEVEPWVVAEGSAMVHCTDPVCGDETKVTAYRGQEEKQAKDNPLFIFAVPYITKKGQVLSKIAVKVTDVTE